MLALFSSLGGLAALLLLAVPVGRYNVKYSDRVYFSVGCPGTLTGMRVFSSGIAATRLGSAGILTRRASVPGSSLEAVWADQNPCRGVPWDADGALVNLTLDSCGVVCNGDLPDVVQLNRSLRVASRCASAQAKQPRGPADTLVPHACDVNDLLPCRRFSLRIADEAHSDTFSYNLASPRPAKAYTGHGAPGPLDARLLPDLGVAAAPAPPPRVYFPTPGLHTLACDEDAVANATVRCLLGREGRAGQGNPVDQPTPRTRMVALLAPADALAQQQQRYRVAKLDPLPSVIRGSRPQPAVCGDAFAKVRAFFLVSGASHTEVTVSTLFRTNVLYSWIQVGRSASVWLSGQEPQSPGDSLSHCVASCLASAPRSRFCSNMQDVVEVDPSFTFWMYLIVRVFVGVIGGTSFAMFEVRRNLRCFPNRLERPFQTASCWFPGRGHRHPPRAQRRLRSAAHLRLHRGHDLVPAVRDAHRLRQRRKALH